MGHIMNRVDRWQSWHAAVLATHLLAVGQAHAVDQPAEADPKPPAAASDSLTPAIKAVLTRQMEAWNRGNIDDFMQHYWKSDQLTFSSGGATTRGWDATRERYRKRYATVEQMGKLSFDQLEVSALSDSAALVLGRWKLQRSEPTGGNFSLVVRRIDGQWLIIHDHTSVEPPPPVSAPKAP